MKKYILFSILAGGLFINSGCAVFTNKGDAAKAEEIGRAKIGNVDGKIAVNATQKMDEIAVLAYGTDFSLSKVNEPPREIVVARDINQRVMSIAGSPTVEKIKEMQETINKLTSALATERDSGKKLLDGKDLEITALQIETKSLQQSKDTEIRRYMVLAQEAAASADAYKFEMDKMDKWFGLGAVFYGTKKLLISSMWILGIGSGLFLLLRIMSMSNPIAASVFSIFNMMGSWMINIIKVIFPKALAMAGNTATSVFNAYRSTMYKLIDSIQVIKDRQKALGDPNRKFTVDELLTELSQNMGDEDKKRIDEIKREIGYT